ncbi:hypothetical protein [Latilactobacillus curvatus]
MTLITDELSPALDRKFRIQLIENFKEVKKFIDAYSTDESSVAILTKDDLDKFSQELDEKVNRLILGTDENTVRIVVEKILKEKGVI